MQDMPLPLPGRSPYEIAFNRLRAYVLSTRPVQSPGVLTEHTVHGVMRRVRPGVGGGAPAQSPTKEMRLKTVYGDHLDCCEIGDTGLTGPTTPVAREARCRRSITTETLPKTDGSGNVVITYTYAAITGFLDQRRKASATGYPDQLEIITPIYLSGEIISVIPVASVTLDGVACVWKETNERYWTQYA